MPKKEQQSRTEALGLRITKDLKQALAQAAEDDGRSIADYVARAMAEHLKREGYLK